MMESAFIQIARLTGAHLIKDENDPKMDPYSRNIYIFSLRCLLS